MIIHTIEQGTDEWLALRCGKITASPMNDVLSKGRGNAPSKTRHKYMVQKIMERITGNNQSTFCNGAMQWGTDTEPLARAAYEADKLVVVEEVGFVELDEFVGCSPDGLIADDGMLEIKCPDSHTFFDYVIANRLPPEYVNQVQSQLWITGRQWCDFVAYDPRVTVKPYFVIRVQRDTKKIAEIAVGVENFIKDMLKLEEEFLEAKGD